MTPKWTGTFCRCQGCEDGPLPNKPSILLSRQLWPLWEWSCHHHSLRPALYDPCHRDAVGRGRLASTPETNRWAPDPPRAGRAGLRRSSVDVRSRKFGRRGFPGSEQRRSQDRLEGNSLAPGQGPNTSVRSCDKSSFTACWAAGLNPYCTPSSTQGEPTPATPPVSGSMI